MVLGKSPILNGVGAIFVIAAFLLLAAPFIGLFLGLLTNASFVRSQNDAAQNKNLPEVNKKAVIVQSASQNETVKQPDIFLSLLTSMIQKIQSDKQIPQQQQPNAVINPNPFFRQMPSYNPYPQYPSFKNPYSQIPQQQQPNAVINPSSYQNNPNPFFHQMPSYNPSYNPYSFKNPYPQYPFYKQTPSNNPYPRNPSFQQIPKPYSQLPSFQQMPYNPYSAYMPPAASPTTTTTVSSTTPFDTKDIDSLYQDLLDEDIEPCFETLEGYEEYVKSGK